MCDYCRICPECGARLDPGEVCDCQGDELEAYLSEEDGDG